MNIKKYIESAMMDLLKKKSIDKIKVNEITREVGTCKGTFYKYYKDKYELLNICFKEHYYDKIIADSTCYEEFMLGCIKAFSEDLKTVLNAFESKDINSIRRYHESIIVSFLTAKMQVNNSSLDEVTKYAIKTCASNYTDMMLKWLKKENRETDEEFVDYMSAVMPRVVYAHIYSSEKE